jgi:cyanoexosortase B-associated protein
MSLSQPARLPRLFVVLFVLAIALTNVIPGYLGQPWPWQQVPKVSQIAQLKALQKTGLKLTGWQMLEQKVIEIGGHKWSAQAMVPVTSNGALDSETSPDPVWLLLRPQTWDQDMPQIDWVDINGVRQWTTDQQQQISFAAGTAQVEARFLRGWTEKATEAVLQWYARPGGGHPAPSRWFWADQWAQLHQRQRQPWVAVSIQVPIEPLGEIEAVRAEATSLGKLVQSALMTDVF